MNRPQPNEYPTWGEGYINEVKGDIIPLLEEQINSVPAFFLANKAKENYAYADTKWTIKEMLGHIIDTERILVYRLTCFSRGEKAELPGFDEDEYVKNADFSHRSMQNLCDEFALLRKANLHLIKSLNEVELNRKGVASGNEINVRSIVFILAGHIIHHINVVKERYL